MLPTDIFPGNCYSEEQKLPQILAQQLHAHELIGAAEEVLWPAREHPRSLAFAFAANHLKPTCLRRMLSHQNAACAGRVASRVAILAHRSSNVWDPPGTAKWENQTEHTMTYQADQFGLYLALAIHGGVQTDFVDEDAVLNKSALAMYQTLFVTEPNVPRTVLKALGEWVKAGGKLVLSGGAATADEYNASDTTLQSLTGSTMTPFRRRLLPEARQLPGPSPLPFAAEGFIGAAPFVAYGDVSSFTKVAADAKALGTFADQKSPCAVETGVGSGRIVQLAWQPGFSYLINATQEYHIPDPVRQFPAEVRQLLRELAGSNASHVSVRDAAGQAVVGVETVLLAGDAGAVVTVVNWGGADPEATLSLTVDLAAAGLAGAGELGRVVDAASGAALAATVSGGAATVKVAARLANFVVLHRAG